MESRKFSAFKVGYSGLWDHNDFICPADESLVFRAFSKFFLKYQADYGARYVIFAAPTVLGESLDDLIQRRGSVGGFIPIQYYSREEKLPIFDKERILKALLPELADPWEFIDGVTFERAYTEKTIENKAWT